MHAGRANPPSFQACTCQDCSPRTPHWESGLFNTAYHWSSASDFLLSQGQWQGYFVARLLSFNLFKSIVFQRRHKRRTITGSFCITGPGSYGRFWPPCTLLEWQCSGMQAVKQISEGDRSTGWTNPVWHAAGSAIHRQGITGWGVDNQ